MKIRARDSSIVRCVYCHGDEDIDNSGLTLVECSGCRATMHIQCRHESDICATLGCTHLEPVEISQFYRDRDRYIDYLELLDNEAKSFRRCDQCDEWGRAYHMVHRGARVGTLCMECIRNNYVLLRYRAGSEDLSLIPAPTIDRWRLVSAIVVSIVAVVVVLAARRLI